MFYLHSKNAPVSLFKINSGNCDRFVVCAEKEVSLSSPIMATNMCVMVSFMHNVTLGEGERVSINIDGGFVGDYRMISSCPFFIRNSTIDLTFKWYQFRPFGSGTSTGGRIYNCIDTDGVSTVTVTHQHYHATYTAPFWLLSDQRESSGRALRIPVFEELDDVNCT